MVNVKKKKGIGDQSLLNINDLVLFIFTQAIA